MVAPSASRGFVAAPDQVATEDGSRATFGVVLGALAGMAGAWIAGGSIGLTSHFLRRGLAWVALGVLVLFAWRGGRNAPEHVARLAWMVLALAAAVAAIAQLEQPAAILGVAVVLGATAWLRQGADRRVLVSCAAAVFVLALWRFGSTTIPAVWMAADALSQAASRAISAAITLPYRLGVRLSGGDASARLSLSLGPAMIGLDFLVPSLVLAVAVPFGAIAPTREGTTWSARGRLAAAAVAAVLAAHVLYWMVVALGSVATTFLPPPPPPPDPFAPGGPPPLPWSETARRLLPWSLPAVAGVLHLVVLGVVFGRARFEPCGPRESGLPRGIAAPRRRLAPDVVAAVGRTVAATLLAVALPILTVYAPAWRPEAPSLHGKKIVLYEKGFLNWLRPRHGDYGRLSIGMYGMVPDYLTSLGATCVRSANLSKEDLEDADALVLFFPNEPWTDAQFRDIWDFVRGGGTLFLAAEHTIRDEPTASNRFNELLEPTAIRVNFDCASFAVGGWLHSYEPLAHPTTIGIEDQRNEFGAVIGASLDLRAPARPILVGRWGWSDAGDVLSSRALIGNDRYDCGERLGDVVLAAEQPLGRGRVVVFGDTSGFTNGLTIGCHEFTSRLYAYLGEKGEGGLRGFASTGLVRLAAFLLGVSALLAVWRPGVLGTIVPPAALAVSLVVCGGAAHRLWTVVPDGGKGGKVPIAYIDDSHLSAASAEGWREDGTLGLCMTLMRSGYLTLALRDLSAERLEKARLLVSIAPMKPYRLAERERIRQFVRDGGIFILTVGHEESGPSRALLADFGFSVGTPVAARELPPAAAAEPKPLGHFKSPFFNGGDYFAHVRFHAAWPVDCDDVNAMPVAFYPPEVPVILARRVGRGVVAVIGDTGFAMNKNHEREDGQPFEGQYENAVFWRWFLSWLSAKTPEDVWYPPNPAKYANPAEVPAAESARLPAAAPSSTTPAVAPAPKASESPPPDAPTAEQPEAPSGGSPPTEEREMPPNDSPTAEQPEMAPGDSPSVGRPDAPSGGSPPPEGSDAPPAQPDARPEKTDVPPGGAPSPEKPGVPPEKADASSSGSAASGASEVSPAPALIAPRTPPDDP